MFIVYHGVFADGVEIADTGDWAGPGAPIDVPDDLAGHPPVVDEHGELVLDPETGLPVDEGGGLLAQAVNWRRATPKEIKAATLAAVDEQPVAPAEGDEG